ncbi:MAG: class I mannose-6-phosphate isomerase [Clostridiales bacterium]|jgi:mannose-6-phosphate isomerase|nr:class I mannose-6-phosphate isomerase [Clostridiales bacterium]
MDNLKELASQPIFFDKNRVYRVYLGGASFEGFFGDAEAKDDFFPEEWIASKVKAINPRYFGERDGVSKIAGTEVFFDDLLNAYPKELLGGKKYDCLVKILDSAIRLPVQVHPTKAFSRKFFNSDYGKTEAWLVVATRENAKIYFGFKDKITKDDLSELEQRSENERDVMSSALASVPARIGDIWLINAGLVHAIGAGCTILEVQEPTDFTIQPENWCGGYHISDDEKYIGLKKSDALDCFNFDLFGAAAVQSAAIAPKVLSEKDGVKSERLIGYDDTPCFALNRYTLASGEFIPSAVPAVWVVLDGKAEINGLQNSYSRPLKKGDYFFLPAAASRAYVIKGKNAVLAECLPSKQ